MWKNDSKFAGSVTSFYNPNPNPNPHPKPSPSPIPKPNYRLLHEFPEQLSAIEEAISTTDAVLDAIKGENRLQELAMQVLAVGNILNNGTTRGGAFGFRLSALEKLRDAKGNDEKIKLSAQSP